MTSAQEFEKKALVEYLKVKLAAEDWHAVSDAANDLRVLEATRQDDRAIMLPVNYSFQQQGEYMVLYKNGKPTT